MSHSYRELLQLQVTIDGVPASGIAIAPTAATQRRLRNQRLIVKPTADGLRLIQPMQAGQPLIPPPIAPLEFDLHVPNAALLHAERSKLPAPLPAGAPPSTTPRPLRLAPLLYTNAPDRATLTPATRTSYQPTGGRVPFATLHVTLPDTLPDQITVITLPLAQDRSGG